MGRTAAIYRIHPYAMYDKFPYDDRNTEGMLEVVKEGDKYSFIDDSPKYNELLHEHCRGTYMGSELMLLVKGDELNEILETDEYSRDDVFLIIEYT